jgi:hypothetical protein
MPDFLARYAATMTVDIHAGMTIQPDWPIGPLADDAREIGIESFHRFSMESPALAVMQPLSTGGALPDDPGIIVDWIEGVVAESRYLDLTEKLRDVDADERQIFVVTGSATLRRRPLFPLHRGRPPSPRSCAALVDHARLGVVEMGTRPFRWAVGTRRRGDRCAALEIDGSARGFGAWLSIRVTSVGARSW